MEFPMRPHRLSILIALAVADAGSVFAGDAE
jgi:hypothetical protein